MVDEEALKTIEKRRSYRTFDYSHPVEKEVEKRLMELTLRAPSAGNMQLYSVIRVTDPEKKAVLARTCDNQKFIEKAPLVWLFLADSGKWFQYFKLSGSDRKFDIPVRKPGIGDFHLSMQDAMAAAQTCVLAAESLGLRSCYIGDIIENFEEVRDTFNLPPFASPAALLVMGYPKEEIRAPYSERPDADAFFMENGYPEIDLPYIEKMYSNQESFLRERKRLPLDNTGTMADYYFQRKYTSDFMSEMNRSVKAFLSPWLEDDED